IQRRHGARVELGGGKRAPGRDVRDADQGMHQSELPRVVQLQARHTFAGGEDGGLAQGPELPAIDEGLQDVLLHIEVAIENGGEFSPEEREVVDGLGHRVVSHVVGGGLSAEQAVIPDGLFDEPVAVVAPDDGGGEIEILDDGLQLAAVAVGDRGAEDHRELAGVAERAGGGWGVGAVGGWPPRGRARGGRGAARRWKIRLSQYSTWAKNRRWRQPASCRSRTVKNGVKRASHFSPQLARSRAVRESARSWSRRGSRHFRKALVHCWKSMPSARS